MEQYNVNKKKRNTERSDEQVRKILIKSLDCSLERSMIMSLPKSICILRGNRTFNVRGVDVLGQNRRS